MADDEIPADEYLIMTTTTDSENAARTLATGIIEQRLAACAQVIGPITSVYRWEDDVQVAPEWRLEAKTTVARAGDLAEYIHTEHSYDVPEIISVPISGGSGPYLSWLTAETTAEIPH